MSTKKTDAELLAESQALDAAYAQAEAFDRAQAGERELDAYGHLTWTLGDLDWMACFDAVRVGTEIHWHVVVNCESGGWIDTLETGAARVDDSKAMAQLIELPGRYVDSAIENHLMARQQREPVGRLAYRACEKAWAKHIRQLIKEAPSEEDIEEAHADETLRKAALNRGQP